MFKGTQGIFIRTFVNICILHSHISVHEWPTYIGVNTCLKDMRCSTYSYAWMYPTSTVPYLYMDVPYPTSTYSYAGVPLTCTPDK
jgi:hypothetical protein